MSQDQLKFDISKDDLNGFKPYEVVFASLGETMIRDMPVDMQRLEMTREVFVSLAGSELTLTVMLSRLGIPSAYITRVPDNPYGWLLRDTARSQGVITDHFVWAAKTEPMGRLLYELGRTPRKSVAYYQRMYSAASKLDAGMVNWEIALKSCKLLHSSGISFGLAYHSNYEKNYILNAFTEAIQMKPADCLVGMDFNYRASLWKKEQCRSILTPLITNHIDILITTIEDMAEIYDLGCGKYSVDEINNGDIGDLTDNDLKSLMTHLGSMFKTRVVALTIRYPDTFEQHRWETAVMNYKGDFFRSPAVKPIVLLDRLGGGDTWNGGFYYGLITEGTGMEGLEKGVLVGDAATRLKQTQMFDLPIVTKSEIQSLMKEDVKGGGKRVSR